MIQVIPQWEDVEIRREHGQIRSATMRYNIIGTDSAVNADSALLTQSDKSIFGNLYRTTSTVVPTSATNLFEGTVEYEYKNTDEFTYSFDTSSETQRATHSISTLSANAPPGMAPPNHYGAIGVNNGSIEGCDVIVPTLTFSMTRTREGILTMQFIQMLYALTGKINISPFLGFLAGEVLFEGASGSQKFVNHKKPATEENPPLFDITYKFRLSYSESMINVGDIRVNFKRGWDYFWVQYIENMDGDSQTVVKRPVAAYVEQVYRHANLNVLLDNFVIPTS